MLDIQKNVRNPNHHIFLKKVYQYASNLYCSKEGSWGRSKRGRGKRRNSCAIVTQYFAYVQLLRNYCAIVAPKNPEKQGEVPGNQLLLGTIALPSVNYCATIASLPATPFTPTPIPLQFKLQCFLCPSALRKGKYCQYSSHLYRCTPPICISMLLPFVSQRFWENLGG